MDPFTHAASGVLAALAMKDGYRPTSRLFFPFAAMVAAFPDVDVFFGGTAMDYLLLHRGITHSLAAIPLMAFFLTLLAVPLWLRRNILPEKTFEPYVENPIHIPKKDARKNRRWLNIIWPAWIRTQTHPLGRRYWSFRKVYLFSICLLLLHIWLDIVTTYGTMIFLPFSTYRVRLNGLFIVDFLLIIPLLLAIWHGGRVRQYAIMGLLWVFIYPSACVGVRLWHEHSWQEQLAHSTAVEKVGKVQNISILPDVFAPFYWRVLYQTDKPYTENNFTEFTWSQAKSRLGYVFFESPSSVYHQGLNFLGKANTPLMVYPALRPDLAKNLTSVSRRARAFDAFLLMPIQERLAMPKDGWHELGVYDLRFSTMFTNIYEFLWEMNDGQPTFLMAARGPAQDSSNAGASIGSAGNLAPHTHVEANAASPLPSVTNTTQQNAKTSQNPLAAQNSSGDSAASDVISLAHLAHAITTPVTANMPMAFNEHQSWTQVRLAFSGAGRDSGWQEMVKPQVTLWWQKLMGINY